MYFFKVEISSFDDAAKTLFIIPEQLSDEQGVPFEEKMLTAMPQYRLFVKETKTNIVDCTYTQYKTDAVITPDLTEEQFEILNIEGKLITLDSNTFSITTGKTSGEKNKKMYLAIGGVATILILLLSLLAFRSAENGNIEVAETTETMPVVEASETVAETTAETTTVPEETEISEETTVSTFETEYIDEPPEEITTELPNDDTDEDGYTDSGYTASSSSGAHGSSSSGGIYTISFSNNGGEGEMQSISSAAGQYVTLPSAEEAGQFIRKIGYRLIGFSDNTEIPYPLYSYKMPHENVRLFAVWEPDIFTVTYDSNGGTGQLSRAEVKFGGEVPLPTDIAVYNGEMYLSGWAKADNDKTALKTLKMPAGDITLYAVWSEKPPTAKITLHYDDKIQVVEVEIGSVLDMLDDFGVTKDGEIVSGWYFEDSPQRIENLRIDGDCDVYAKWQKAEYITVAIDQSYLDKEPLEFSVPLDMTGKAKLTLPVVDDKNDIYNSVFGCTYGFSAKKQNGEYGTIEYYGGEEAAFFKNTTLYRVLNEYGGGKGTADKPYIISCYDQLIRLAEKGAKGYFIQVGDIKFPSDVERKPIDSRKISRGYENKAYNFFVYDGQGYSIKNLRGNGGLFGTIAAGTIKNVVIDGADIHSGDYKNVGALCNEIVTYAFPSAENEEFFTTGNTVIQNCAVKNSRITADNAVNIGGICGYGGLISDCFTSSLTISGGENAGGIVGNACNVTGCLVNSFTADSIKLSSGGIAGTAYGIPFYENKDKFRFVGGNIIGCGVRTFTSTAENSGGIVGTASSGASGYIKSCYAANIYLNGKNNGGIAGADGIMKEKHRIAYCLVDNTNKYPVIGGDNIRSIAKTMVLSVPADTGLTVEGVLSVLGANGSGYTHWERDNSINGGYPYPENIKNI